MDNKMKINLNELNNAIREYRYRTDRKMNLDLICYVATQLIKNTRIENRPIYIKIFNNEEALSIVIDFFESLGVDEWTNRVKSIIWGEDKRIGINIYNYKDVTDEEKNKKDENGIAMHTIDSSIESIVDDDDSIKTKEPRGLVRISKQDRYYCYPDIISKDKMTIEDINSVVHEIAHSFDLANNREYKRSRNIYAEITPFCFERMLSEYLVRKNIASKSMTDAIDRQRLNDVLNYATQVYTVINLIRIQERDGIITKESINKFTEENGIKDINYVRRWLLNVINKDRELMLYSRYVLAGITSLQFLKMYKEDEKQAINNLKQYCQRIREADISDETFDLVKCPYKKEDIDKAANEINEFMEDKNR